MSLTRHAPDPNFRRETLCGETLVTVGTQPHWLAQVGDTINCEKCRVVINAVRKCVSPNLYRLVRAP